MGKPKSDELRRLAIHHSSNGSSVKEIRSILANQVSERTLRQWLSDYDNFGKTQRRKPTGRPVTITTWKNKLRVKRLLDKKMTSRKICKKMNLSNGSFNRLKKELVLNVRSSF